MKRIAVFPGSFDPVTKGHQNLILRASAMYDEVIVAIGENNQKKDFFPLELRKEWLNIVVKDLPNVHIDVYQGLTVEYCKNVGAGIIIRGIRTFIDFEFESHIAFMNKTMIPSIETVFLASSPELIGVKSSLVREVVSNGGDPSLFIPAGVKVPDEYILKKLK